MKYLLVALALISSPSLLSQPLPDEKITPEVLAEFLSIESFEVEYELPAAPVDVNLQYHLTIFDENGKEKEDHTLSGVGHIYAAPPAQTKQKLLLMASPDKSTIFTWDDTSRKYVCSAWSDGWKRLLEKVEQTTSSYERPTGHIKLELGKRSPLKTWTKNEAKVAELSFAVTAKPLPTR